MSIKSSGNAKEIFLAAIDIQPGEEREAFLRQECGEDEVLRRRVNALLLAHESPESLLNDAAPRLEESGVLLNATQSEIQVTEAASGPVEGIGTQVGPYKLLQKLGEGGFGIVYMAQQSVPLRRKVALKIIKQGMDTQQVIARFEAERQALAMMEHPNIAKVLDAGATETGRPYFVMELVRGDPITHYCDTARLDTEARLRLFMDVCCAVQHAHQKGIIHRDIKPSNVMVTLHDGKPVPKVIDFGIAKATQQELTDKTLFTEYRQFIGTPAYMSPEQAEMSGLGVDTRSDIYSLGVLLYELLTGTTPFEADQLRRAAIDEIVRMIRQDEPPRPSVRLNTLAAVQRSLGRNSSEKVSDPLVRSSSIEEIARSRHADADSLAKSLSGDLDWIVMKTLEKDRSRRYATAIELATDVQRHLQFEPVLASPPSTAYRMRKYVRRNRGLVIAVVAVAFSLLAGFGALGVGLLKAKQGEAEAKRQRDIANNERDIAEQARKELREAEISFAKEYFFTNLWRGDFQAASDMLTRAGEFGVEETWSGNARAMLAQFQGDAETAREELRQVLESSPEDTFATALLSMVDYWDGDELAWAKAVERLAEKDHSGLNYDEKLVVAYALALPYPDKTREIVTDLEASHRNYPVVRLLKAFALHYLAIFSDDANESRQLLLEALDDLKFVEGALGNSPLTFQALISVNLQARNVWRDIADSSDELKEGLREQAKSFEQTALAYADEAVVRFPSDFEAIWACANAFQESEDNDRFSRMVRHAELPREHPLWNHIRAFYELRVGNLEEARQVLAFGKENQVSSATEFIEDWVELCDASSQTAEFRDALKDEVIERAEKRIASQESAYLFIDLSTLLLLGERDKVSELASQAIDNIDDVQMQWFAPAYDCLKKLDFDANSLKNRWKNVYERDEDPKLMLAYIHFYAGCDSIGQGELEKAKSRFQSCIDQGVFFIWIHSAARAFLIRMNDGWPEWVEDTQ